MSCLICKTPILLHVLIKMSVLLQLVTVLESSYFLSLAGIFITRLKKHSKKTKVVGTWVSQKSSIWYILLVNERIRTGMNIFKIMYKPGSRSEVIVFLGKRCPAIVETMPKCIHVHEKSLTVWFLLEAFMDREWMNGYLTLFFLWYQYFMDRDTDSHTDTDHESMDG